MFSLVWIMPPRVMTESAGRPAVASRGGGTVGRAVSGGGRTRGHSGDHGDGRIDGQGGQVGGQGSKVNDGVNGVTDFSTIIAQQNQNDDAVNENIQGDVSRGCTIKEFLACNPKEYDGKGGAIVYTCWIEKMELVQDRVNVGDGHAVYTDRFHELARLVPHLVTPEGKRIERHDCNRLGHLNKDCRVMPRNVNPVNARNPTARTCFEYASTDHIKSACPRLNQARGRAFMLGSEEARQDLNIMTGIEPSNLGFSYEIEITISQLVKIDKVIKGCKLEIEGHMFDINLIPFRSGSFDMIIRMDWLSNHKAEIICHKKVVRIPLPGSKVLRVIEERPEEKDRHLMSAKAKEMKQEEIW
nr:hypothetical protein [Tanacetum cinerariifolium]